MTGNVPLLLRLSCSSKAYGTNKGSNKWSTLVSTSGSLTAAALDSGMG